MAEGSEGGPASTERAASRARPLRVLDDEAGRATAIEALRRGEIVALPTDTVYGIAIPLETPEGIEQLFAVKRRPPQKGIALLLGSVEQGAEIGILDHRAHALARRYWPGPLTIVVPARPEAHLPEVLTGGLPTVGLRLPDHPAPRALAAAVGPLPTTSANLSGDPDSLTADEVVARLGDAVAVVLDGGRTRGAVPSTVVDLTLDPPVVHREGVIPAADVLATIAETTADALDGEAPAREEDRQDP